MLDRVPALGRLIIAAGLAWRIVLCELLAFELTRLWPPHLAQGPKTLLSLMAGAISVAIALGWFMRSDFGPYRLRFEATYPEFTGRRLPQNQSPTR